jgi:transcriptional regulator with XRE-family HTH domain
MKIPDFSHRLVELRSDAGFTQRSLAEKAGITREVIARIENKGWKNRRIGTLLAIASALGVTIAELLGEEQRAPAGISAQSEKQ